MIDVVVVPLADVVAGGRGQGPVAQRPERLRPSHFDHSNRSRAEASQRGVQLPAAGRVGGGVEDHHEFAVGIRLGLEGGDRRHDGFETAPRQPRHHQAADHAVGVFGGSHVVAPRPAGRNLAGRTELA